MSSVFVDLVPLKDVSVVPERGTATRANDSRRSSADVVVQRVTTYQMSGALGPQRAAQCWGRSSGARSTAASGRRPTNAQTFVETCEIRDQSTPEVDQRYEAFVATAQARNDAREAPMAAALGEPSRVPRCGPGRAQCQTQTASGVPARCRNLPARRSADAFVPARRGLLVPAGAGGAGAENGLPLKPLKTD